MHICHVTTHFHPFIGGLENLVMDLAVAQAETHRISVLTLQHHPNLPLKEENGRICIYRHPAWEPKKDYRIPKAGYTEKLKALAPDVIFTHTRFFMTSYLGGKTALKARIKNPNLRWIHVEHGEDFVESKNYFVKTCARVFDEFLGKWVVKNADQIIVLNEKGRLFMQKFGAKPQNIHLIPNGVAIPKTIKPAPRNHQVVFIGRLVPEKGLMEVLEAAKHCPRWHFTIIGAGPLYRKLNQKNIVWKGIVPSMEISKNIQAADLVLSPSYSEGFGLVVAEASANKRPVLSTPLGVAPNIVSPRFLIPPKNSNALIQQLQALQGQYVIMETEGKKNYDVVKKQYNFTTMCHQYEHLLKHKKNIPICIQMAKP